MTDVVRINREDLLDEAGEHARQAAEEKVNEIIESGEAPSWARGESNFDETAKSIIKQTAKEVSETALEAYDKAAHKARNNPGDLMEAAGRFAQKKVGSHTEPIVADKAARMARHQKFTDDQAIGTGNLAAKWFWYAAKAAKNARGVTDHGYIEETADKIGDEQIKRIAAQHRKDLQSSDFGSGGSLIPAPVSEDVITFLFGLTTFRELGPQVINLNNGSMTFPKFTSAVSASWRGEASSTNASTPGTGEVKLDERFLQVYVILTKEMIRHADVSVMEFVQNQMQKEATRTEETSFLRGTGTNSEPAGLRNLCSSANQDVSRTQSGTESSTAEIIGDLLGLPELVYGSGSEVVPDRGAYVMQHRTASGLMALTDGNGNLTALAQMIADRNLFGYQVGVTTQLPENLDVDSSGNTDHTELYFAEFSEVLLGQGPDMEIDESDQATIFDSGGNPYRPFPNNARVVKLEHGVDLALAHDGAAANLKNVDWGSDLLPV